MLVSVVSDVHGNLEDLARVAEQAEFSERERSAQMRALVKSLAGAVSDPFMLSDYTTLESLLLLSVEYPSVLNLTVFDGQGKVLEHVAIRTEITQRKQLEEQQGRLAVTVHTQPGAMAPSMH